MCSLQPGLDDVSETSSISHREQRESRQIETPFIMQNEDFFPCVFQFSQPCTLGKKNLKMLKIIMNDKNFDFYETSSNQLAPLKLVIFF